MPSTPTAPAPGPNGNGILWQDSFIDPANGISTLSTADVRNCPVITPQIGITDTPVIDPNSGIMYFVAATKVTASDGTISFHQQLHALNIKTGQEALGGPVEIQAADLGHGDGGNIERFDPLAQLERDGLVLANGVIYTTWTSHCDFTPVHGWVIAYDAQSLQQVAVFNTTPNAQLGTIWSGAPAVDANGNLFFVTGNGRFPQGGDFNPSLGDYPTTVLKLSSATGQLQVADYFTPFNWDALDKVDRDLGSGSVLLLPDQAGPVSHLLVVAGKEGKIYLINRDRMGGFNQGFDDVVQELPGVIHGAGAYDSPAYFDAGTPNNRWIYYAGRGDSLRAFQLFDNGTLSTSSVSQSSHLFANRHGAEPSLSANGTTNAIVWAIDPDPAGAVLFAYDATNLANELYDSSQAGTRDQLDGGIKFTVPTIADGQVFVGTAGTLTVFGLLPGGDASPPSAARILPLLGSLASQGAPAISDNVHLASVGQVNPVVAQTTPSGSNLAPLTGSTDQFARDSVFARIDSDVQHPGSGGRLSAQDIDLFIPDLPGPNAAFV